MCNITFPTTVLIKIPLAAEAVIGEDIGIVDDTRDFLSDNSEDCFLKRRTNGTRRKCITLLLKDIRHEYAERLNEGMFGCSTYLLLLDGERLNEGMFGCSTYLLLQDALAVEIYKVVDRLRFSPFQKTMTISPPPSPTRAHAHTHAHTM